MDHRLQNIEGRLEKIESKQDQILQEMIDNRIVNERNTTSLEIHIKRSDMLQEELEIIRAEMKPIEKHITMVSAGLKLLGLISLLASLTLAIVNISKLLH
jgi:hypothetical protein